jgi:hypothetical protein
MDLAFNDDDTIFREALHLFEQIKLEPVRLLGVGVSNFTEGAQLSLFGGETDPTGKLTETLDEINRKFAPGTITKGRTLRSEHD